MVKSFFCALFVVVFLNFLSFLSLASFSQTLYTENFSIPSANPAWELDVDGNILISGSPPSNGVSANRWVINTSGPDNIDGTSNLHISCLGGSCDNPGPPVQISGTKFNATSALNNTNKVARMPANFPATAFSGSNLVLEFAWKCNNASPTNTPGMILVYSTTDGATWIDRTIRTYSASSTVQIESIPINSTSFSGFNSSNPKLRVGFRWFNEPFVAPAPAIDNGLIIDNLRIRNVVALALSIDAGTPTTICQGAPLSINYTATGYPPATTFSLELSNPVGSFATPTNLGVLGASPFNVNIPAIITPGSGYKIRIKASDNTVSNITNLNIRKAPNPFIKGIFSICSGSPTTLTANPTSNPATYNSFSWFLNNNPIAGATNTLSAATAGSYSVRVDSLGCVKTSNAVVVTNQVAPNATINGSANVVVCMDGTNPVPTILKSNSGIGLSYQWFKNGIPVFPNGTLDSLVITSAGTYTVEVTSTSNGCKTVSAPVTAVERQVPPIPNAGLDSAVCSQDVVTAGFIPGPAFAGLTFNWIPTTGVLDFFTENPSPNSPYAKITLTNNGAAPVTYFYRLFAIDPTTGCSSSDQVKIIANPNPQNVTGGEDRVVCENGTPIALNGLPVSTPITANPQGIGEWTGAGITAVGTQSVFTPSASLVGLNVLTYTYFLDWNNGGKRCQNFKDKNITVNPAPQIQAGDPKSFCNGIDSVLLDGFTPAFPVGTWSGPSISPRGRFYPSALPIGTYVCTLSAASPQGCIGTGTRTLTITAPPLVNAGPLSQSLCSNLGSYQMTGFSPAAGTNGKWTSSSISISSGGALNFTNAHSGIHVLRYTFEKDGCKTVDSVFMTIVTAPKVVVGANDSICSSAPPKILGGVTPIGGKWKGPGIDTSGTTFTPSNALLGAQPLLYKVTINNCADSAIRIMFVKSSPIVDAGRNDTICANLDSLVMSGFTPVNGKWSGPGINIAGVFKPKIAGTGNKIVTYTVRSSNGCEGKDQKQISIFPLPQAIAGLDTATCTGDKLKIGAEPIPNLTYKWFEPTIGSIPADTISNPFITLINTTSIPTKYSVRLLVTDTISGCIGRDTSNITVYPRPTAVAKFPSPKTKCFRDSFTLKAVTKQGLLYEWLRNGLSLNIPSEKDSVLKTGLSGKYILVVRNKGAFCTDSSEADSFSIYPRFIPRILGPKRFCKDSTTQLRVSPENEGFSYEWQYNGVNVPDSLRTTFTIGRTGTVRVILRTDRGCQDSSIIEKIDSLPFPSTGILNDTTICENSKAIFKVPTDSLYFYRWIDSTTQGIISTDDTLMIGKPGKYYVEVYNSCRVERDSVLLIRVNPLPRFGILNNGRKDTLVCKDLPVKLFGPLGYTSYVWKYDTTGLTTGRVFTINTKEIGEIPMQLTVTDEFGCSNSDSAKVQIVECAPVVYIPTAFSPQGDGQNEFWELQKYNVTEIKITVFNRWGQMVFFTDKVLDIGWDGKFNGTACPSGAYKWMVEYKGIQDGEEISRKQTGTVTIIR